MRNRWKLSAESITYAAAKCGKAEFIGIADVVSELKEKDYLPLLLRAENELLSQNAAQMDFDGNVELDPKFRDLGLINIKNIDFSKVFRTITTDNGSEFARLSELETGTSTNDYVFGKANGKTPVPGTLTSWFKTFIRRNKLPDIQLHDLRHTAATLMIEEQCPITAVAGKLGHATPATTTTIYAHALQRASAKTANVMQNLFEKKKIS